MQRHIIELKRVDGINEITKKLSLVITKPLN